MRRISRGSCPVNLDGPGSSGHKERLESIAHHTTKTTAESTFSFVQYRAEPVKAQLALDYSNKCAYCESFINHVSPTDIDHFRPKGAYRGPTGANIKPGYYWLGSEWDNLFPACPVCNRSSRQLISTGGLELVGKSTRFPLVNEANRATVPGAEAAEEPLLLNPDQSDLERHLEFKDGGVVVPASIGTSESDKGKTSIDIYGLQRTYLVTKRGDHLKKIEGTIVRYKRERDPYIAKPNDPEILVRLEEAMKEIKGYLCSKQEYLTMARQYIARECPELSPLNGCPDGSCSCP